MILLGSCATSVPKPESGSDTLLLFVVDTEIPVGLDFGATASLMVGIWNVEQTVNLSTRRSLVSVSGLATGAHRTEYMRKKLSLTGDVRAAPGVEGLSKPKPFEVPFELKPGYMTVFPVKFTFVVSQVRGHSYMGRWVMKDMSEGERRAVLEDLAGNDAFALWKNDYGVK